MSDPTPISGAKSFPSAMQALSEYTRLTSMYRDREYRIVELSDNRFGVAEKVGRRARIQDATKALLGKPTSAAYSPEGQEKKILPKFMATLLKEYTSAGVQMPGADFESLQKITTRSAPKPLTSAENKELRRSNKADPDSALGETSREIEDKMFMKIQEITNQLARITDITLTSLPPPPDYKSEAAPSSGPSYHPGGVAPTPPPVYPGGVAPTAPPAYPEGVAPTTPPVYPGGVAPTAPPETPDEKASS